MKDGLGLPQQHPWLDCDVDDDPDCEPPRPGLLSRARAEPLTVLTQHIPSRRPRSLIHCFQEWEYVAEQLTDIPRGHRELRVVNQLIHGGHRHQPLRSRQLCHCSV